jgi:ATP-dependent DNA helicase RecG
MITPQTLLKSIPRITPKYAVVLEKLGLRTVQDLLLYFPFRYDDFSQNISLSANYLGQIVTVEGIVTKTKLNRIFRRRMTIVDVRLEDANGTELKAVWFNQPFIMTSINMGDVVRLSGKLILDGKKFSMSSPAWEKSSRENTNTGILVPVYSETKGITSKWIRWQLKPLLSLARQMNDPIPEDIRKKLNLFDLPTALEQIHFPSDQKKFILSQKRFAFQEMFLVQLKALQLKNEWSKNDSIAIKFDEKLIKHFVGKLPFKLTDAQRKASFEILKDLEKPRPMNRLLNGDVGSGKTVVAAISALQAAQGGFQIALLAPTEVLAKQHFRTFSELLKNYDLNIALFTNSYREINNLKSQISNLKSNPNFQNSNLEIISKFKIKNLKLASEKSTKISRNDLLSEIKNGNINLLIGTHAIIQKDVHFKNLALVIIDEQHRFGVVQRAHLQQETLGLKDGIKKAVPHLLSMTATPIPRTLSIAFTGSLDLSVLDEMPKNRKPIITKIVPPTGRKEIYNFIAREIETGRQVFVILPLIEESKAMTELKAATTEYKKLAEIFPNFRIGLLHGRLKTDEKEKVMRDFKDKKTDILVSTSVIEVGIDIPNASVMIIEDAERFGLSQLHQFRGRVGRGEHQSYCFLFSSSDAVSRLEILAKSNDGFVIAQKDLEQRGPGQFFGTIQSGLPDIAMENLGNIQLIKHSRAEAQNLLTQDPQLKKHPATADALERFNQHIHME